jgi:diguanylate cyclase (GGDEF)-like protein/PAS domain S-box-containing protein
MSLIVIIDDRSTNRNIFAKLAATIEPEVNVQAFGDPVEALAWLEHNQPDLVITDYKMPQMDGADFIRRFRSIRGAEDIPVIVITVYEERTYRLRALEAGATDFLHSPVDHHEFVTRARNLLKLHQHQVLLAARATTLAEELENSERTRERELRDSSQRLAQVIDSLPVMITATAPDGQILFANAPQAQFLGLRSNNLVGRNVADVFNTEVSTRNLALDQHVFRAGTPMRPFEEELTDSQGSTRTFLTAKYPIRDQSTAINAVVTSSLDISAQKRIEAHLRHLAHHDALTELPNRVLLHERMRRQVARARRGDNIFALHMLDLDGFKSVNDVLGHSAGDRYIRMIADRLRSAIREEDTLARLGGDEFAIIQTNVARSEDAAEFAQRILELLSESNTFEGTQLRATASLGIAVYPSDGEDGEELLKNADIAMYRAKAERGNRFCFFAADMKTRARNEALLDGHLQRALERKEFVLWYQPQIDLRTGKIVGAEALLRWQRPGVGLVSPAVFLPRAEESGLIGPIDDWAMIEACGAALRWQKYAKGEGIGVAVNLSPTQFRDRSTPLLVARALGLSGLDPRLLELELTESTVLEGIDQAAADLTMLRNLGVRVAVDDFGVGYSSLTYIKRLPITRIKIDQSFVRDLGNNQSDIAIVRAIITLGHGLGLEILAEGVETLDQAQRLMNEGCDFVQGYYFARPMPETDFINLLASERAYALSA